VKEMDVMIAQAFRLTSFGADVQHRKMKQKLRHHLAQTHELMLYRNLNYAGY